MLNAAHLSTFPVEGAWKSRADAHEDEGHPRVEMLVPRRPRKWCVRGRQVEFPMNLFGEWVKEEVVTKKAARDSWGEAPLAGSMIWNSEVLICASPTQRQRYSDAKGSRHG